MRSGSEGPASRNEQNVAARSGAAEQYDEGALTNAKDGWLEPLTSIPNWITAIRLAALPVLWLLAAFRHTTWLGLGLGFAAFTDVIDGIVARRWGQTTEFGSRLDSFADHLMTASTVVWLFWLRPEFFHRERLLLSAWVLLGILALLVGWIRFRRVGGLHLYTAKVAGTFGYLFAIALLLFASYPRWVFFIVIGLAFIAVLETLAVFLFCDDVDENGKSILLLSCRSPGRGGANPAGRT
jgi:cardiolipin synthase (CMP-forming)